MTDAMPTPGLSDEQLEILRLVENQLMTADEAAQILEALDRTSQPTRPFHMTVPPPPTPPERQIVPPEQQPASIRIRITDLSSNKARVNLVLPSRLVDSGIKMVKRMAPEQMSALDGKGRDIRRSMDDGFRGPLLDITDDNQRVEIIVEGGPRDERSADTFETRKLP